MHSDLWRYHKSAPGNDAPGERYEDGHAITSPLALKKYKNDKPNAAMSKICQITGKKAIVGNNVSHSKRRTKRKFNVNLFTKKFFWVEQQMWISLTISAKGLRTINKLGLNAAMLQAAEKGYLNENDIKFLGA